MEVFLSHAAFVTISTVIVIYSLRKLKSLVTSLYSGILDNAVEIANLSKFTKDMIYNHIEVELNKVNTSLLLIEPEYEYEQAMLRYIKSDTVQHVSQVYLSLRSLRNYPAMLRFVKEDNSAIIGAPATNLVTYFKYLSKDKDGKLQVVTFPKSFITKIEQESAKAGSELLQHLSVYATKDIELNALRGEFIASYTTWVSRVQSLYFGMLPELRKHYSDLSPLEELVARNKLKEALERLSLQRMDPGQSNILILLRAQYATLTERLLQGIDVADSDFALLRSRILNFNREL